MDAVNLRPVALTRTTLAGVSVAVLALGLAGCVPGGPTATSRPSTAVSTSATPTDPVTPTIPGGTTSTPTPTAAPKVDAKGSLSLYMAVSNALSGTCTKVDGVPVLSLADEKNDFYGLVTVSVRLAGDARSVAAVNAELGEDSEGITRTLAFDGAKPASGTSAKLVVKGRQYAVTGKVLLTEAGATKGEVTPFSVTVTCAPGTW